jgi:hypothetical protein
MSNRYWLITTTGERFPLTRSQLMSDPGNSLAAKFIGDDKLQSMMLGELVVDEEVALVKLIHAHLRGYEVLPLLDGVVPYLSKEATLRTFLNVARQFRLHKLQEKVERSLGKQYPSRRVLWSGVCIILPIKILKITCDMTRRVMTQWWSSPKKAVKGS